MEGLDLAEEERVVVDEVMVFWYFESWVRCGFGVDDLKRWDGASRVLGNEGGAF